ncbi:hypothetical protein OIU35_22615 [Boseaceae bacterium BT-24-1]|nr:hypothetical protein [Boseaceae bacterium BT-24-1]
MGKNAVTMRELQKMSAATIRALPHAVPIKSDGETVGMLMPFKKPNPERMKEVLDRIEQHYAALPEETKEWLERFLEEREH